MVVHCAYFGGPCRNPTLSHFTAAAARQFHHDDLAGFWTWRPLEPAVVDAAARIFLTLPLTVYLRSADCLHLVTAIHHKFADVYTHDKHQSTAAAALGLNPIAVT